MGHRHVNRYALTSCVAAALLAGCGGSQVPIGPQDTMLARRNAGLPSSYHVLYSFGRSKHDAGRPATSLVEDRGTLYGTTPTGGKYTGSSCPGFGACGTVFSVTTSGKEHILYNFRGGADGYGPTAALIAVNGTLYGSTSLGGTYGFGTIFSISTTGAKHVLYNFEGAKKDGAQPQAALIDVNGLLYGTTPAGGKYGRGTVFRISTSGKEHVLYAFHGRNDGSEPLANLIDVNGTLYGTTSFAGAYGKGTAFSITLSGSEQTLYSFGKGSDGGEPAASLIDVNGTLYGTTAVGGSGCAPYGCGTVFKLSTAGQESVLYSFLGAPDGDEPLANLVKVKGALYGTTQDGGAYSIYDGGTVFSISTTGKEHVVHSFGSPSDGEDPTAGLIDLKGTLYGSTTFGGTHSICSGGCGVVFALTP